MPRNRASLALPESLSQEHGYHLGGTGRLVSESVLDGRMRLLRGSGPSPRPEAQSSHSVFGNPPFPMKQQDGTKGMTPEKLLSEGSEA